jgi:hypothetical protein
MRVVLAAIIFLFGYSSTLAQQTPPVFCDHKSIHLDWPGTAPVQLINDLTVTTYAQFSESYFKVVNRTESPIIQIAALIEFFDDEGRHLITLTPHVIAPGFMGRVPAVPPYFELDNGGRLDSVLFPGDATYIVPASPIVMTACPARASLTLLQVDDIAKNSYHYQANNVRVDPALRQHISTGLFAVPVSKPYEKLLPLKISDRGMLSFPAIENYPDDLPDWLGRLINSWVFSPTLFNGQPLEQNIDILFRFHITREQDWSSMMKWRNVKQIMIVVDIYPGESKQQNIEVSFGRTILD